VSLQDGAAPPDRDAPAAELGAYGRPQPFGLDRLTSWMNAAGTLAIFALLLITNADIVGRDVFNKPLRGTTEILSVGIVAIVFMQLPNTLWAGRFPRADFLIGGVARRSARAAALLMMVFHLIGAAMLAILCIAIWPELVRAWELGDYYGALGDFTVPLWPVRLIMVTGCALTALTYLFLAAADLRAARGRPPA
jgi:TRAP-type mannitol/chloroaromatic compound transport system permease small subunit